MAEPRLLGQRYELDEVLDRGDMAEVWRGRDLMLGRVVAIKMLRVDRAADATFQAQFRRKAQSAASLNHRSIVAVYDTGEDFIDGRLIPYIVMEYVEGRTLRELQREPQRERAKFTPERTIEVTASILDALEYSHRSGIVHRDIKPGNVMISTGGDVKVMDFGIARSLAETGAALTQTAAVVETAQYISPEQARGEAADARSDLYATGCVMYELLTGRPPFVSESLVSVAVSHVREMVTPPSALDPSIPRDLDAIVLKALAKDRLDRYQSAYEMRADLGRAAAGFPVMAAADETSVNIAMSEAIDEYPEEEGLEGRGWIRRRSKRSERHLDRSPSSGLDTIVGRAVTQGAVVFNTPEEMRQGRVERVEVAIARSAELVDGLLTELRGRRGEAAVERIRTSSLMEVTLTGPSFDILPFSPPEQLVAPKASWEFDVRPRSSGLHTLTLGVTMRVDIPDHPGVRIAVPVLEKVIRVRVDIPYGARQFFKANWQWLVVTLLGLGGAISAWAALLR